jgi:hypothetical protein
MIPEVICSVEAMVYGMMNKFRSAFRDYIHVRYDTVGIEENRTHRGLPALWCMLRQQLFFTEPGVVRSAQKR